MHLICLNCGECKPGEDDDDAYYVSNEGGGNNVDKDDDGHAHNDSTTAMDYSDDNNLCEPGPQRIETPLEAGQMIVDGSLSDEHYSMGKLLRFYSRAYV